MEKGGRDICNCNKKEGIWAKDKHNIEYKVCNRCSGWYLKGEEDEHSDI